MEAIYKEEAESASRQSQNVSQPQNPPQSQNASQSQNSSQSAANSQNATGDQTGSYDIVEDIAGITEPNVNQSDISKDEGKTNAEISKKKPETTNDTENDKKGPPAEHVHAQGICQIFA